MSGGREWARSETLEQKFAHLHSVICKCLKAYHRRMKGRVQMKLLLKLGGKQLTDLTVMEKYLDRAVNQQWMCFNYICGHCTGKQWHDEHLSAAKIMDTFATQFCQALYPGMEYLLKHGELALGGADKWGKLGGAGNNGSGRVQKQQKWGTRQVLPDRDVAVCMLQTLWHKQGALYSELVILLEGSKLFSPVHTSFRPKVAYFVLLHIL